MTLSKRSLKNLEGVHPDLIRVVKLAVEELCPPELSFIVTEGVRPYAKQVEMVKSGASQRILSRHLTGHAVDMAVLVQLGGKWTLRWDWPLYDRLAGVMLTAAKRLDVPVEWGGAWNSLKDGPHFELNERAYPADVTLLHILTA